MQHWKVIRPPKARWFICDPERRNQVSASEAWGAVTQNSWVSRGSTSTFHQEEGWSRSVNKPSQYQISNSKVRSQGCCSQYSEQSTRRHKSEYPSEASTQDEAQPGRAHFLCPRTATVLPSNLKKAMFSPPPSNEQDGVKAGSRKTEPLTCHGV